MRKFLLLKILRKGVRKREKKKNICIVYMNEDLEYADKIIARLDNLDIGENLLSRGEKLTILKKAQSDALYQFYKGLFSRQYVVDFMTEGKTPLDGLESNEQKLIIERARNAVVSKPPYALITINPYHTITLDDLEKYVNKYKKRKFIDAYMYVYEVRKEDLSGLHCHMIVKYNCKPYDLKRNTQNTFKHVCDESNPSILNIKYISEDILPSKIEYLKGHKKDDKLPGVNATKEFRFQNGLARYYDSTPPLPCRGAEEITDLQEQEGEK